MRALKKIMAALALTAVLAGCSADNILSSIQGGKAGTVQTVRPRRLCRTSRLWPSRAFTTA